MSLSGADQAFTTNDFRTSPLPRVVAMPLCPVSVLCPAELKFKRFKKNLKNDSPNFSTFLLVVQIKFNFNKFARVCHSLASCQRHTPSSLAVVIGLSNNDVISLRSIRCVRCVGWEFRLTANIKAERRALSRVRSSDDVVS